MNNKHEFICSCGNSFTTTFAKFQNRNKTQCNTCGINKRVASDKLNYSVVKDIISKYGCELLSKTYTKYHNKDLEIKCSCGKSFITSLSNFKNSKHQCPSCSTYDANISKNKYSIFVVKQLCIENNSELIDYSGSEYINTKSKIQLKCNDCGKYFITTLGYVLYNKKFNCNDCAYEQSISSKGEYIVRNVLNNIEDISFKEQYSFEDCKDKFILRFDFAVFTTNNELKLIEFDGIQHFKAFDYFGGKQKLEDTIKKDNIKNNYCLSNKIPLLRIKYNENIEDMINKFLTA